MALQKYKITDKQNAATNHVFVLGQTKYINDNLSDEEAAVLFENGNPFIALNENYLEPEVKVTPSLLELLTPKH
ncbi:hypothetical protein ACWA1C_12775 [Flectobacillus roseus]